jgi:hypothetical protein
MIASPWSSVKGVPTAIDGHASLVSKTFSDDFSHKGLNILTDFTNRGTGILPGWRIWGHGFILKMRCENAQNA